MATRMGPCRCAAGRWVRGRGRANFLKGAIPFSPKSPSLYVVLAKVNLGYLNRSKNFFDWGGPRSHMSHMFNISGHNVNFVCGLVNESIDQ